MERRGVAEVVCVVMVGGEVGGVSWGKSLAVAGLYPVLLWCRFRCSQSRGQRWKKSHSFQDLLFGGNTFLLAVSVLSTACLCHE